MDLMHASLSGKLSHVVSWLSTPLVDEPTVWPASRCGILVKLAVRLAPPHLRERLAEEWCAHINDTPGTVAKLLVALDLVRASGKLRRDAAAVDAAQRTAEEACDDAMLDAKRQAVTALAPTGLPVAAVGAVSGWDALGYWFRQEQAATIGQLARELQGALEALDSFDARLRSADAATANPALQRIRTRLVDTAAYALWHFVVQRECMGVRLMGEHLKDYRVPVEVRVKMGAFRSRATRSVPAGSAR